MLPQHVHDPNQPQVLNFHEVSIDWATTVSIMRPNKYGNPYVVGRDGTRGQCIVRYQDHIKRTFAREEVMADLEGKDLLCCCKPKPCHGDWLLKWANPLL